MAEHVSVLLDETIDRLNIRPDGIYVDGTLGMGGHSAEIVRRLGQGRLIAIDRDPYAIERSRERLAPWSDKITFVRGNFRDLGSILDEAGVSQADGMVFDLGVSSPQLDEPGRGFSYMADAPLDMRMDTDAAITADQVVNNFEEPELTRILRDYGEERYAQRIAAAIVRRRKEQPIKTTLELVEIIRGAMPSAALREKQHPAKRTFQALRIAVNDELNAEKEMLSEALDRLTPGGRLCVISFHSLEDRIVKAAFRERENGCTCPPDFPVCVCGFHQTIKTIGKPVTAGEEELKRNPRSRSARLRTAEKL